MKIQESTELSIILAKILAVPVLEFEEVKTKEDDKDETHAHMALKRKKLETGSLKRYVDTKRHISTSNICKCFIPKVWLHTERQDNKPDANEY